MAEDTQDPGIAITASADTKPKLTPVEYDPFTASKEKGPKLTPVEHDPFAESEVPKDKSFSAGVKRGYLEGGLGIAQALNEIGVGGVMPTFVNGKLTFGYPPNDVLARREETLEEQGQGTGLKGSLGETIGSLAANATPLLPAGRMGLAAQGATQAGLSALTSPTTRKDQTTLQRLTGAGIATPVGAVTGGILGALGNKIFAAPTGRITEGTPLYQTLNKMGISLTGKETPNEVWDKLQTSVRDRVDTLAEAVDKGSSVSRMWPVSTNLAISKMYEATRQAGSVLYDTASRIGKKLEAPARGLSEDIGKLIEDAKEDTLSAGINPKFRSALGKLGELKEDIARGVSEAVAKDPWSQITHILQHGEQPEEKVTGSQLIELDQALNQLYGRSGQGGAAGKLYSQLQNKVNDTIKSMSPEFGGAYQKAKDYWKTQVIQNFKDNKALQAFWKPEDYDAYKALGEGLPLHPNVKTRVVDQLDKIKNWNDLDVLKNQLPPEMYNTVRAHKFINLMDKAGIDAKALSDEKNYALLAKTLGDKPEQLHVLDAIKTFAEQMQKRGITGKMNPMELQESDKLMDRSVRTVLGFVTQHKLYGLSHAWDLLSKKLTPETEKGALRKLSAEAAGGRPQAELSSGGLAEASGLAVTRAIAPQEGKESQ